VLGNAHALETTAAQPAQNTARLRLNQGTAGR
jgi:hypothetical protein